MNRHLPFLLAIAGILSSKSCTTVGAELSTAERDQLQFAANQPERIDFRHIPLPIDLPRFTDPDAEVIAPPPVPPPITTRSYTLTWNQPSPQPYAWRVLESTNLVDWYQIGFVRNEYCGGRFTFNHTGSGARWTVAAFTP